MGISVHADAVQRAVGLAGYFIEHARGALTAPDLRPEDAKEFERQFAADMKDDLLILKSGLKLSSVKALFSKEIGLAAVAAATVTASPAAWPATVATLQTVGVGALIRTAAEYREARSKALRGHVMRSD